jgi:amidohydrolase
MDEGTELKNQVAQDLQALWTEIQDLGQRIHDKGLSTAFRATYGRDRPAIAFLAEYDALPNVGHACGHNLIAAAAAGAGAASRKAIDHLGGSVQVIGTPGEELYGGKAIMVRRGAFDDVDVAMMIHPGVKDTVIVEALACISLEVDFFGRAAHAAAHPEQGVNALEALILAFNNINSLRQHIPEGSRVHGIITKGGEAANIVPDHCSAIFLVRAEDVRYLEQLRERVLDCFVAAATATGTELEYQWGDIMYAPLRPNPTLADLFCHNIESSGRRMSIDDPGSRVGSTDMGNVSQIVPSIHPLLAIGPPEVSVHSPEFAEAACSETGHRAACDGARAMALTLVDLLASPELRAEVRETFLSYTQHQVNSEER